MRNVVKLGAMADAAMRAAMDLSGRASREHAAGREHSAMVLDMEAGLECLWHKYLTERFIIVARRRQEILNLEAQLGIEIDVVELEVPRYGPLVTWWEEMRQSTSETIQMAKVDDLMTGGL